MLQKISFYFLFFFLFFLDQYLKQNFLLWKKFFLLDFLFNNKAICNSGIAFGLPLNQNLIWILNLTILAFLILYFEKTLWTNHTKKVALGIIITGACSNLIDRFRFGCVIDYLNLPLWPSFNLADLIITIGAILLVIKNLKK